MTDLSFHDRRTQLQKALLELAVLNSIAAAVVDGYDVGRPPSIIR